jgi:hypothetical protein
MKTQEFAIVSKLPDDSGDLGTADTTATTDKPVACFAQA